MNNKNSEQKVDLESCNRCRNDMFNILFPKMKNIELNKKFFVYMCSILRIIGVFIYNFWNMGTT